MVRHCIWSKNLAPSPPWRDVINLRLMLTGVALLYCSGVTGRFTVTGRA